jgi:ribosomal protein RSM22 (predicted rRNA methylase)
MKFPKEKYISLDTNIEKYLSSLLGRYQAPQKKQFAIEAIKVATAFQNTQDLFEINNSNFLPYFIYFFPRTYLACKIVIANFVSCFKNREEISILDVGCGTGAATAAFINVLKNNSLFPKLSVFLNDINHFAIDITKKVLSSIFEEKISFNELVGSLPDRNFEKNFDCVLISFSLYNITNGSVNKAEKLIRYLQLLLKEDGAIFIVEPADRIRSTFLTKLRDCVREYVIAPCTHTQDCPLLKANKWCHFRFEWKRPSIIQNIFYDIGCDLPQIKFSYLVVSKNIVSFSSENGRIITPIFREKGRVRFKVCSFEGVSDYFILYRDIKEKIENLSPNSILSFSASTNHPFKLRKSNASAKD